MLVNTISKQVIPDFQKLIDKNDKICIVKRRRRECSLPGSKFQKAPETVGCKGYHKTIKCYFLGCEFMFILGFDKNLLDFSTKMNNT